MLQPSTEDKTEGLDYYHTIEVVTDESAADESSLTLGSVKLHSRNITHLYDTFKEQKQNVRLCITPNMLATEVEAFFEDKAYGLWLPHKRNCFDFADKLLEHFSSHATFQQYRLESEVLRPQLVDNSKQLGTMICTWLKSSVPSLIPAFLRFSDLSTHWYPFLLALFLVYPSLRFLVRVLLFWTSVLFLVQYCQYSVARLWNKIKTWKKYRSTGIDIAIVACLNEIYAMTGLILFMTAQAVWLINGLAFWHDEHIPALLSLWFITTTITTYHKYTRQIHEKFAKSLQDGSAPIDLNLTVKEVFFLLTKQVLFISFVTLSMLVPDAVCIGIMALAYSCGLFVILWKGRSRIDLVDKDYNIYVLIGLTIVCWFLVSQQPNGMFFNVEGQSFPYAVGLALVSIHCLIKALDHHRYKRLALFIQKKCMALVLMERTIREHREDEQLDFIECKITSLKSLILATDVVYVISIPSFIVLPILNWYGLSIGLCMLVLLFMVLVRSILNQMADCTCMALNIWIQHYSNPQLARMVEEMNLLPSERPQEGFTFAHFYHYAPEAFPADKMITFTCWGNYIVFVVCVCLTIYGGVISLYTMWAWLIPSQLSQ